MNLTTVSKKIPVKEVKPMNLSPSQKELMKLDMDSEIPQGKYKGKKLSWVAANDSSYYSWMQRENLLEKWNLLVIKKDALKPQIPKSWYVNDSGQVYISIRETGERTWPCPERWLE